MKQDDCGGGRKWLTPALCRRFRALCGRKAPTQAPKRLGRARMPKLLSAGAVSTNALLGNPRTTAITSLLRHPLRFQRSPRTFTE
jgi:hypothetical protein